MNIMSLNKKFFTILLITPFVNNASFAVVNFQKVMTESIAGKDLQEKLQREQQKLTKPFEETQASVQAADKKVRELNDALQKDAMAFETNKGKMRPEELDKEKTKFEDKALELETKKRTLDRDIAKLQADYQKIERKMSELYQAESMKLTTSAQAVVEEERAAMGWAIVHPKEALLAFDSKYDKTDHIIKKFDEKTKAAKMAKKEAIEQKAQTNAKK